ncbi:flagellar basal body-associated FliL family protein [Helicobacter sp. 11S02629-2]|uniref:flagellar basal body-associated FliL family protein n=1 Tax=Helicobacter sp. 11S02629-2 TaxID=1476195 RepID=UPI000BA72D23|nr:flagellar basal body-associated FliL family protein [Helicobacter sp. 11S02629-2]PAF45691.1 hypothetical protein BKH40_02080 [Helicobacter sp. 11S02629-2]
MNKRPIIVLVIFIIVLIIILVLLFLFYKPAKNISGNLKAQTSQTSMETKSPSKIDILKTAKYLYVFKTPFVVDLRASLPNTAPLKLRLKLSFVLENKQLANELDTKEAIIREIVSDTASTFTPSEVEGVINRDNLRNALKAKINQVLEDGKVEYVVFEGFNIDA